MLGQRGVVSGVLGWVVAGAVLVTAGCGGSAADNTSGRAAPGAELTSISTTSPSSTSPSTLSPSAATSTVPTSPPATTGATTTSPPVVVTEGPPPSTEPAAPREATLVFGGDIITHLAVGREGRRNGAAAGVDYDFAPLFAQIAPTVSAADLAICHLESPLAAQGRFQPYPRFNGPAELAHAIAGAGFDGCSLASNHSYDQLAEGVTATLDVFDEAGLGHAGTARSAREALETTLYDAAGITVAHLSYTYWLNGFELDEDRWRVSIIDGDRIEGDAWRARQAGAEFVVVSLHWGQEYQRLPTSEQVELAERLARSGVVGLVVGHHAHVIQPVATVESTMVFYGLGNLLSNQEPTCCTPYSQDGVLVEVELRDTAGGVEVVGWQFTPTWVERGSMTVLPVLSTLAHDDTAGWIRNNLEASLERTLDSLGLLQTPLPGPR